MDCTNAPIVSSLSPSLFLQLQQQPKSERFHFHPRKRMEEEVVDWTCEEEEIFLFLPLSRPLLMRKGDWSTTHSHTQEAGEKKKKSEANASDSLREGRGGTTTTTEKGLSGTLEATGKKGERPHNTRSPLHTNALATASLFSALPLSSFLLLATWRAVPAGEPCGERERKENRKKKVWPSPPWFRSVSSKNGGGGPAGDRKILGIFLKTRTDRSFSQPIFLLCVWGGGGGEKYFFFPRVEEGGKRNVCRELEKGVWVRGNECPMFDNTPVSLRLRRDPSLRSGMLLLSPTVGKGIQRPSKSPRANRIQVQNKKCSQ